MCVSALVLSKGIAFCYVRPAGVVMRGRYVGLTLPNPETIIYLQSHLNYGLLIWLEHPVQTKLISKQLKLI